MVHLASLLLLLVAGPATEEPANPGWEAAGWGDPPAEESRPEPVDEPTADEPAAPSPATKEPSPEDAQAKLNQSDRVRAGDMLGGSLRLTSAYLHFDDEPLLFPSGDDALGVVLGRFTARGDPHEHLRLDFNGFLELSRVPFGAGSTGNFASAGSTRSAYRTRFLTWEYWESGTVGGRLGVDRAALKVHGHELQLDVGRFPVNYSVTAMFSTNDFFAPFSATAINTLYKPGIDGIRASTGLGSRGALDLVGVLGSHPDTDLPEWDRSALLSRASIVGGGFEWAALGGKVAGRWVGGGSAQGEAGPLTLRAEFHVGVPDVKGNGHDASDRPIYGRVSGGPGITFAWQNANLMAEYMYASDGAAKPSGYIERATSGYQDDLPYLGRHYAGLAAGMELIPILRMTGLVMVNASDGSGMGGLSFAYNVADESDLILGLYVPWGRGLRGVDPSTQNLELGSEFGLSPLTAYFEARVFF